MQLNRAFAKNVLANTMGNKLGEYFVPPFGHRMKYAT